MKKVIVAMSGGVDSSVSAALLKKEGWDVLGVFMRLHGYSENDEKRAKKVAAFLKIPFKTVDLRKEFRKKIIGCFLREYEKGNTPNPCVICNREIKFGRLLDMSRKFGADYIATGHYVQIKKIENRKQRIEYKLLKGTDKTKDQSYFLWKLGQSQLKNILFPVGGYEKTEVRALAKKFKLPVDGASESQEICFVPKEINDFLKEYLKAKSGNIVKPGGKILGRHEGLHFYTIGQRKGIKLSGGPYYVTEKDYKRNRLIVTKNEKDLFKKKLTLKNVNWISGGKQKLPLRVNVKIRYRAKETPAIIFRSKSKVYNLKFKVPQRAVTPGQSAVFYKENEVLGGGIII